MFLSTFILDLSTLTVCELLFYFYSYFYFGSFINQRENIWDKIGSQWKVNKSFIKLSELWNRNFHFCKMQDLFLAVKSKNYGLAMIYDWNIVFLEAASHGLLCLNFQSLPSGISLLSCTVSLLLLFMIQVFTYNSSTSPRKLCTTTLKSVAGRWTRAQWSIGSAGPLFQNLSSARPMRPASSFTATTHRTNPVSTSPTRVRRIRAAHGHYLPCRYGHTPLDPFSQ